MRPVLVTTAAPCITALLCGSATLTGLDQVFPSSSDRVNQGLSP